MRLVKYESHKHLPLLSPSIQIGSNKFPPYIWWLNSKVQLHKLGKFVNWDLHWKGLSFKEMPSLSSRLCGNRIPVNDDSRFSFICIHGSVEGEMILAVCLWATLEIWTIADLYGNKNKIWVNKIFAKQRSQDCLVQSSGNPTPISTIKAGRASFPSTVQHASLGDVCKFPSSTHQADKLSSFLWGNNILLMSGQICFECFIQRTNILLILFFNTMQ